MRVSRRGWLGSGLAILAGPLLNGCAPPQGSRQLAPASTARKARPVHLDANENPFGPSPRVVDAVRLGAEDLARYAGDEADALARQLAALEGVRADQILLGEVLAALGTELALEGGPGGEFIYSTPGYTALTEAARFAGGAVVGVPLDDRLENDLPTLGARVNARTRALFLVNPHNPSGTVSDPVSFKALVERSSTRALVIVDEAYLEFTADFSARTCVDLVRSGHNVAVFRTFSKIHALAALPLGYAVLPTRWAERLRERGLGQARSLNRLAIVAAGAAVSDSAYVVGARQAVERERARWFSVLTDLKLRYTDSRGNFVFFETGRPHQEVAAAMLARGVIIGRAFPPLDHWARISVGLPEENALAQRSLREALQS